MGLIALLMIGLPSAANATTIPSRVQAAVDAGNPVWVFLKDKGPSIAPTGMPAQGWISERAAARIARRGGAYDATQDQPIFDDYRRVLLSSGLLIRAESRWLNAVSGVLPAERFDQLASLEFVDSLSPVAIYRRPIDKPLTDFLPPQPSALAKPTGPDYGNSRAQIEAIEANTLHDSLLDGRGVRIGFLDSGFSLEIDAFSSLQIIGTRDFINRDSDVGDGDTVQMGHGTSTLSVCGGYLPGYLIGVAPRAEYALAKTEVIDSETQIEEDYWVAGLWWIDSLGCDIVSSSLGYIDWYTQADLNGHTATTTRAAEQAAQRGLLVVNSAGNEGAAGLIAPADGDSVLTVGASDFSGNPTSFSSRGPTADNRIKPDVVAPGAGVWAALTESGRFAARNGTSFSTPLVAGVCALLLQKSPNLTPMQVIDLLRATASGADNPVEYPNNDAGWGMVRAAHALAGLHNGGMAGTIEAWPNPAHDSVWIVTPDQTTELPSRFDVFTVAGEPVYSREFRGWRSLWLGTNSADQPVASGVYLVRVKTPVREGIVKVALIRK